MARTNNLTDFLTDVADAIREKGGTSELIQASDFDTAISNIPTGDDVGNYINLTPTDGGNSSAPWWQFRMVKPEIANLVITTQSGAIASMFNNCKWTYLPKLKSDVEFDFINMVGTFQNCSNVATLDLSGFKGIVFRLGSAFNGCTSLTHLDIRGFSFNSATTYSSAFNSVPTNCLIIVKDTNAKTWITSKFSTLTNVKTVAEYEA